MTYNWTNPQDKLFSEVVNPMEYTQICNHSFTTKYSPSRPRPMLVHLLKDDSYLNGECDGCGKDNLVLRKVRDPNGCSRMLCRACIVKRKI